VTRTLRAWAPALLWAALLFFLSSRSQIPAPRVIGIDKVGHACVYGVLCWLLARALPPAADPKWAVVLASLYGVSDEIHQAFVPGRSADPFDWAADTLGALAVLYLLHRLRRRRAVPSAPARALPAPAHD
jgi:VanZ family protein